MKALPHTVQMLQKLIFILRQIWPGSLHNCRISKTMQRLVTVNFALRTELLQTSRPYSRPNTYYPTASTADGWGATTNLLDATSPLYNGGIQRSSRSGKCRISKPEMTAETEFGGDFRFFSDRTSLNLTQYYSKTTDAILPHADCTDVRFHI